MKKFLIIEDDQLDYETLVIHLRESLGYPFDVIWSERLEKALELISSHSFDLIFLDLGLPDSISLEDSVSSIHNLTSETPLLLLTGNDDLETGLQAVQLGAQDYLVKGVMPPKAIGRCVEFAQIRKQVENRLISQKESAYLKNKYKSLFLASASHDLRAPLTAILNVSPILRESESDPQKIELLNILEKLGETQLQIIDDILDVTKLEAGEIKLLVEPLCLSQEIESVIEPLKVNANKKGLELSFEIPKDISSYIETDSICLRRILYNLINNSLKFTNEGFVRLKVSLQDKYLFFQIQDSGVGIPPNRIKSVFKTFEQNSSETAKKYGGSGLGLSICKQRVKLLGGEIGAHSTLGEGSTFYFSIPYVPTDRPIDVEESEGKIGFDEPKKILIADDDESNHVLLKYYLGKTHHEVTMVYNGQEALDEMKKSKFDLILLDMQMDVMDGYEAARLIREYESTNSLASTPIVAFTASVMQTDIERCYEMGCSDILSKPYRKDGLLKKIASYRSKLQKEA